MRSLPLLGFIVILAIAGCADPRNDPTHLEPGNSIRVASDALAAGNSGTSGRYDDGSTIGAVPYQPYPGAPNVPEFTDVVADYLFFWQVESLDGESQRDPVWVKVKVAESAFASANAQRQKSLLQDAEIGIPRRNQIPRSQRLRAPANAGGGAADTPMPLVRQGQPTTRVTVAGVDPSGQTQVLGSQVVPTPAGADPSTTEGVNRMLQRYNDQVRDASAPGSGASRPTGGDATGTGGIERLQSPGATTPVPAENR